MASKTAQGKKRKEKEKWEVRVKKYKNVSIMNNRHDDIASALPANLYALPRQGKKVEVRIKI